jgi:hypothetical protein
VEERRTLWTNVSLHDNVKDVWKIESIFRRHLSQAYFLVTSVESLKDALFYDII